MFCPNCKVMFLISICGSKPVHGCVGAAQSAIVTVLCKKVACLLVRSLGKEEKARVSHRSIGKDPRNGTLLTVVTSFCGVCKAVAVVLLSGLSLVHLAQKAKADPAWLQNTFLKARRVYNLHC